MNYRILPAYAQYMDPTEPSGVSKIMIKPVNHGACPLFCGFTHIEADWVDPDLDFTPQCSRKVMSETEFKKDGTPKIYISCRAGCGLHKTKQIFRFHDCLGVQIRGHPLIPKTMFNGTRIKTTENWMCAKSQFRDSIINVTQAPVPIELQSSCAYEIPGLGG